MTHDNGKTDLIIIRHGKTCWNLQGRIQGTEDIALHPVGRQQAEAVAERLAQEEFSVIYSSDLKRAYQTAECIARKTQRPIITHQGLRERNFGIFQGMTAKEIAARHPKDWERFRRWDPDYVVPNGASLREYYEHGIASLKQIARQHPGERLVIVTHGGILNGLIRHTLGIPYTTPSRFWRANTGINIFFYQNGAWFLRTWGDTNHLRDLAE